MVATIFTTPLAQVVLVFVLVFVIIFAMLQKSKVFGEGKKQIDAMVALVAGLIVTSVGYAIDLISNLIPFMAVVLVIILVFMLLFGSLYDKDFKLKGWMISAFGLLIFIALAIAVLYYTGSWDYLADLFSGGDGSGIITNVIFIVIIIGAIVAVIYGATPASGGDKKKD